MRMIRPTGRAYVFLVTALVLYFFANQTQVGWLYVMSAMMTGAVLGAGWLNRRMLRGLDAQRQVQRSQTDHDDDLELFEGQTAQIALTFRNTRRAAAWQTRLTEHCPLAAPDSPQRAIKVFIPVIPARGAIAFDYAVTLDRRGLHEFPALQLRSPAPFGFFTRQRELSTLTRVLVYPEVRPVSRLSLLDDRLAPQLTRLRAGFGSEVIGARAFRSGDSPRHIHWRSTARSGQLISKEFAEEGQPGLSLVLDLYAHPYPTDESKHIPFEWLIKVAASVGDYAYTRGYPLHLTVDDSALVAPSGAVTWSALLQYLARVQPLGTRPLPELLSAPPTQAFVVVIVPWPDPNLITALNALQRQGRSVLALVIDPESFPAGGLSARPFVDALHAAGIESRLIRFGSDWAVQISEGELSKIEVEASQ